MDKSEQLQWLLDNMNSIQILEIFPNGWDGTPTLLIEIDDWKVADSSPFGTGDSCLMFE